jgi:hypothetical protein
MAQTHYKTLFRKVQLGFITEQDPVLAMLEWVAQMMMLIEAESKFGAEKGKHTKDRKTYFSGARIRRMDTRLGTLYLYCWRQWGGDQKWQSWLRLPGAKRRARRPFSSGVLAWACLSFTSCCDRTSPQR